MGHTKDELYQHRFALFCALSSKSPGWKSREHHDLNGDPMYDDWFVAGLELEPGEPIIYHLPLEWWPLFHGEILDQAPLWDGSGPKTTLARLRNASELRAKRESAAQKHRRWQSSWGKL